MLGWRGHILLWQFHIPREGVSPSEQLRMAGALMTRITVLGSHTQSKDYIFGGG